MAMPMISWALLLGIFMSQALIGMAAVTAAVADPNMSLAMLYPSLTDSNLDSVFDELPLLHRPPDGISSADPLVSSSISDGDVPFNEFLKALGRDRLRALFSVIIRDTIDICHEEVLDMMDYIEKQSLPNLVVFGLPLVYITLFCEQPIFIFNLSDRELNFLFRAVQFFRLKDKQRIISLLFDLASMAVYTRCLSQLDFSKIYDIATNCLDAKIRFGKDLAACRFVDFRWSRCVFANVEKDLRIGCPPKHPRHSRPIRLRVTSSRWWRRKRGRHLLHHRMAKRWKCRCADALSVLDKNDAPKAVRAFVRQILPDCHKIFQLPRWSRELLFNIPLVLALLGDIEGPNTAVWILRHVALSTTPLLPVLIQLLDAIPLKQLSEEGDLMLQWQISAVIETRTSQIIHALEKHLVEFSDRNFLLRSANTTEIENEFALIEAILSRLPYPSTMSFEAIEDETSCLKNFCIEIFLFPIPQGMALWYRHDMNALDTSQGSSGSLTTGYKDTSWKICRCEAVRIQKLALPGQKITKRWKLPQDSFIVSIFGSFYGFIAVSPNEDVDRACHS